MIRYSEEFVTKIKETFPDDSRLYWLLDSNSSAVGRILDEATDDRLTEIEVLDIYSKYNGYTAEVIIKERCMSILNKIDLYSMWCEEYNKYIDNEQKDRVETLE